MLFLEPFLGLSQNQWILIGAVAAAIIIILVTVLLIVKSRKSKKTKKAQTVNVEVETSDKALEEEEEADAEDINDDADGGEEDLNTAEKKAEEIEEKAEEIEEKAEEIEEKEAVKEEKAKSLNKVYHVSKRKQDNKWQVKMSKGAKAIKLFTTQAQAIEYAKKLAVNQEARIIIHKEDGSFRKLNYKSKKQ